MYLSSTTRPVIFLIVEQLNKMNADLKIEYLKIAKK